MNRVKIWEFFPSCPGLTGVIVCLLRVRRFLSVVMAQVTSTPGQILKHRPDLPFSVDDAFSVCGGNAFLDLQVIEKQNPLLLPLWVVEGGDDPSQAVGVNLKAAEQRHQQDTTHTAHIHICSKQGGGKHTTLVVSVDVEVGRTVER